MSSSATSTEQILRETFNALENGFNQTAILRGEPTRAQTHLKQLTNKMADGKKMIKEYGGKEKYKSKAAMKKHEKKESKKS